MTASPPTDSSASAPEKRENLWTNLILNVLLPVLLLTRGGDFLGWAPEVVLVVALAFPIGYGIWDYVRRRKLNLFSIVGFVSVLLTGGIGLLKLPPEWIAVKEAGIPLILGIVVLATAGTKKPLVKLFLMNESVMDVAKVERRLEERDQVPAFQKLLRECTVWIALSFLLSAILNFVLATIIVKTDPSVDAEAFNQEIGSMTAWSYLVILVPTMAVTMIALFKMMTGLQKLTGLEPEEIFHTSGSSNPKPQPPDASS